MIGNNPPTLPPFERRRFKSRYSKGKGNKPKLTTKTTNFISACLRVKLLNMPATPHTNTSKFWSLFFNLKCLGIKILKVGVNNSLMMNNEDWERKSLDRFTLDYIYNKIIELELKNIENKSIGYEYKDRAYSEILRIISDSKIDNRTIQKLKKRRTDLS